MRCFQTSRHRLLCGTLAICLIISPALASTYTVKSGDTLAKIAKRFSVSLDELVKVNKIANRNVIHVGQKIDVPEKATAKKAAKADAKRTPVRKVAKVSRRDANPHVLTQGRARLLAQQNGQQVASAARDYIGTPYHWGSIEGGSRGLDCSGLVVRSMAVLGRDVPHSSRQLFTMGTRVHYAELQSGDLVFFNTMGRGVSHVGIWLGNNRFIHASSSRGVVEDEMKGYYAKRLLGARRLP